MSGGLAGIDDRRKTYPGGPSGLRRNVEQDNLDLHHEIDSTSRFEQMVGSSPAISRVNAQIVTVAPSDATVLIMGESGTGKELIAQAIHRRSRRLRFPFVKINCAAIPPSLIASELFGHEKGAFTGADQRRAGRFESANRGTIFLDEIGDMPAETQAALLRVLQEREFERVGGAQPIPIDVRVIAATNCDLPAAIRAGQFRLDLFYRLNVFPIEVPPLRERREDILPLAKYFIELYAAKVGKRIRSIEKRTTQLFRSHSWPGNIRELQNVIERSTILCDSDTLFVEENWFHPRTESRACLRPWLTSQERDAIEVALAESRGRVSGPRGAAQRLGMPRTTLESKIKSLCINKHQYRFGVAEFSPTLCFQDGRQQESPVV
jgi:formate hydrogenlyase transcriptional activator